MAGPDGAIVAVGRAAAADEHVALRILAGGDRPYLVLDEHRVPAEDGLDGGIDGTEERIHGAVAGPLGGLGPALIIVLAIQTVVAVLYMIFVVFPAMGRDYRAAVIAAGFSGISLGATPTAIANMTAVTKAHGPAPTAFIILPLVSAFFIDIANALVIGFMVR